MDNNLITSNEMGFSQSSLSILGMKVLGLRGWEVKLAFDKEHLFAAGDMPVDIVTGNITPTGSITILGFDFDKLNDAALAAGFPTLGHVPHTLISSVIQMKKNNTSRLRTIAIPGMAFTEIGNAMKQGDKMREVTLPFLAMGISFS